MKTEIVYYTCNTHLQEIDDMCREQLNKAGLPIVCVSLNKRLDFGYKQIYVEGERGPLMMHKQVLLGLELSDADYVFLCESDVLYHETHFELPELIGEIDDNAIYYNVNVWKMRWPDQHFVWTDDLRQVSGIFAHRKTLLEFYTKRVAQIEAEGFNRHYEPGVHQTVGTQKVFNVVAPLPNICIRHDSNITKSKWSPEEFRNQKYAKGWKESTSVPGWGKIEVGNGVQH